MLSTEAVISATARTRSKPARKARRSRKPASAPAREASPPAAAQPPAGAPTHAQLTARYNALVPVALALGITTVANSKVRIHTSDFFTKDLGMRIIAKLEAAIAAAQAADASAAPQRRRSRKTKV